MCKVTPFLQGVAVSASVSTLTAIAFDRWLRGVIMSQLTGVVARRVGGGPRGELLTRPLNFSLSEKFFLSEIFRTKTQNLGLKIPMFGTLISATLKF